MVAKKPSNKKSPTRKKNGLSRRSKKKIIGYLLVLFALILVSTGIWLYTEWQAYQRAVHSRFPAFGIPMPARLPIHGIDVSKYQKRIVWNEVTAMEVLGIRIGFCFIKATEGSTHVDNRFHQNWRAAHKAGIPRGAYHFFIPSQSGLKQARHFLKEVKLQSGDIPPVLDIEQLNGSSPTILRKEALRWLEEVEKECQVKPIIYTNVTFYENYLGRQFDKYSLWVAHYYRTDEPKINRGWLFWQHHDSGRVNGIDAPVDFNVFNGDSAAFRSILLR
jgi:lysozyme